MADQKYTYAFLGATGGCTLHALILTLKAGHQCLALARTPTKLRTLLLSNGIPESLLYNLSITQGDARQPSDIQTLLTTKEDRSTTPVRGVIFGIGSLPKLRMSIYPIDLIDPGLCGTSMRALTTALAALTPLPDQPRPFVLAISTTGIADIDGYPRDVPLLLWPLYKWLLHVPHEDKRVMEKTLRASGEEAVVLRASLLTDGEAKGGSAVRLGDESRPAVGYTVSRRDVGGWIWEKVLAKGRVGDFAGKALTVTY